MATDMTVVTEFLSGRFIAAVATQNPDGSAHVVPIWYLFENGAIYLPTNLGSVKARNVKERPYASVMIDSRGPGSLRAASTKGSAELLDEVVAKEINHRCWSKYCTSAGMADPDVGGLLASYDTVCIKIVPTRWIWSDMGPIFKGKLENPSLVLPYSP